MELEDKYFNLVNLLIYDKRSKMLGMISGILINRYSEGPTISFQAFMNRTYAYSNIFVEDFEKGNVVFLLPFSIGYNEEILEEMAKRHEQYIREFFGDNFREDMIARISEEDRQEEIKKWQEISLVFEIWNRVEGKI